LEQVAQVDQAVQEQTVVILFSLVLPQMVVEEAGLHQALLTETLLVEAEETEDQQEQEALTEMLEDREEQPQ
tara:strand:- start:123 stop:338 length:216 start_codon:yes stop_codon:yes gene_type:complete